ncbi:MAG TPA: Crp/Fnr family transcriptional regulator [Bacteroidota bacterium]|nr:Crp/Fnr family transcriptional regulator [Bacteroidota bacterium]
MIDESLLKKYHASLLKVKKGEMLFEEGETATNFYLVKSGRIKMVNVSSEGREFVQGYFGAGQSFGEPPFFARVAYPASAYATEASAIWKIGYDQFVLLLRNNFEIHLHLLKVLSDRLIYKSTMLSEIAIEEAEHRLSTLIEYLTGQSASNPDAPATLSFTRQQLADMTGLRVETVIRSIKSMEQRRLLELTPDGKIILKRKPK